MKIKYYKITNKEEIHNGLQYKDGLNCDTSTIPLKDGLNCDTSTIPLCDVRSCSAGAIYFTTKEHLHKFLTYGPWVREVSIPDGEEVKIDEQGDKWKAKKIILGPRSKWADDIKSFLPKEIKKDLDLRGTQITALPEGLSVGGYLDLSGTQITALPEGLKVGGSMYLRGTQITALPEGLSVGGSLYLRGTKITKIPKHLSNKVVR